MVNPMQICVCAGNYMIPYNVPLGIIYKVITHVRGVTAEQKAVENHDWAAGRRAVAGRGPPLSKTPVPL